MQYIKDLHTYHNMKFKSQERLDSRLRDMYYWQSDCESQYRIEIWPTGNSEVDIEVSSGVYNYTMNLAVDTDHVIEETLKMLKAYKGLCNDN